MKNLMKVTIIGNKQRKYLPTHFILQRPYKHCIKSLISLEVKHYKKCILEFQVVVKIRKMYAFAHCDKFN